MLKVEFDFGVIEYRLPTVPEALELLGQMGISTADAEKVQNEFILTSKVIANMGKLVTKIDCDFDGEKVTDYETLVTKLEAMTSLSTIAGRILEALMGGATKKKKPSKTQPSSGKIQEQSKASEEQTQDSLKESGN